jgi:hypothetical protein
MLLAKSGREIRTIGSMLATCERCLSLDRELRWTLEETQELVRNRPEKAVDYLVKLRAAVLVPIHDLLSDKLLGPERAAALRHRDRPPSATPECFPAA